MLFKQLLSFTPDVVVCSRCAAHARFCDTTDHQTTCTNTIIHNGAVYDLQSPPSMVYLTVQYDILTVPFQNRGKIDKVKASYLHFAVVHLIHLLLPLGER